LAKLDDRLTSVRVTELAPSMAAAAAPVAVMVAPVTEMLPVE
jgi:hypothetical protein